MALLIGVALVSLLSAAAQADMVSVDFDVSGGPTQAGYESFPIAQFTGSFDASETYADAFGAGQDLTVRAANATGTARTRNRNPVTGVFGWMSNLLHDWVGGGGGFELDLTMPAGSYSLTTYWHDADAGLPDDGSEGPVAWAVEGVPQTPFHITIGDSPTVEIRTIVSPITSDGSAVDLYFDGGAAKLNGFNIVVVPEPATLGLLGLGGLAISRRRRS